MRSSAVSGFLRLVFAGTLLTSLAACDQLGIDTPESVSQRKLAEAKAIGAACRHAGRAIEDCYALNPRADKAPIFDGWKEMEEYMRENKIEAVKPVLPRPAQAPRQPASAPV